MMGEISFLPIETIGVKGGTQSRVALNDAVVAEYAEVIRLGGELPPVIVFNDGASDGLWLADGFHRFHAHRAAGAVEICCDVRVGTRRDAILHSVGANAAHGLRRTNEDKRNAVATLLADPEWAAWSNEAVARACHVSPHTVAAVRSHISANAEMSSRAPHLVIGSQDATRTVERNGITYQQNTANIGKAATKTEPLPTQELSSDLRKSPTVTPELTSDEIRTESQSPAAGDDDGLDLAQMADELQKENEAYQRQIQSLEADDPRAELVRLNMHLDQLNGRLQGEITTRNEAQKMVKHYAGLLERIRKALKVESNREILAALEAR